MRTDAELLQDVKDGKTAFSSIEYVHLMQIESEVAPGPLREKLHAILDKRVLRQEGQTVDKDSGYGWSR